MKNIQQRWSLGLQGLFFLKSWKLAFGINDLSMLPFTDGVRATSTVRRSLYYHMSHVCNHGSDQSDWRINVARFCDLTCTFELWTGTCFTSTESADSSHVRLQISALGRIFAISHGWKFLSFFRAKKLSFRVLFFRALPVRVEYRFHDD